MVSCLHNIWKSGWGLNNEDTVLFTLAEARGVCQENLHCKYHITGAACGVVANFSMKHSRSYISICSPSEDRVPKGLVEANTHVGG